MNETCESYTNFALEYAAEFPHRDRHAMRCDARLMTSLQKSHIYYIFRSIMNNTAPDTQTLNNKKKIISLPTFKHSIGILSAISDKLRLWQFYFSMHCDVLHAFVIDLMMTANNERVYVVTGGSDTSIVAIAQLVAMCEQNSSLQLQLGRSIG